ncbi:hypothetical protein evm_003625 [Chilo suppressalis]|nr:hypothetical protein evm_003625 [Chilo suppressalis]
MLLNIRLRNGLTDWSYDLSQLIQKQLGPFCSLSNCFYQLPFLVSDVNEDVARMSDLTGAAEKYPHVPKLCEKIKLPMKPKRKLSPS